MTTARAELIDVSPERLGKWSIKGGILQHNTGRFFQVVRCSLEDSQERNFILQPEIGLLGLMIAWRDSTPFLLLQKKYEPGCIAGYQLTTTIQATKSNLEKVHGGASVPYSDVFRDPSVGFQTIQAEQADVFINKYNRNCILETSYPGDVYSDKFAWISWDVLKVISKNNYLIHSNLLSVIGTYFLIFSNKHEYYEVFRSNSQYVLNSKPEFTKKITYRRKTSLEDFTSDTLMPTGFMRVEAPDREIASWIQPLVVGHCGLVYSIFVTYFGNQTFILLKRQARRLGIDTDMLYPFISNRSLSPSLDGVRISGKTVIDVQICDEGGRFYHGNNRLNIISVDTEDFKRLSVLPDVEQYRMEDLQALCLESKLSIEARSAMAFLTFV